MTSGARPAGEATDRGLCPADAIVLAGGGPEPTLDPTVANKALIPIAGRSMIAYVLDALRGARGVGKIAVVGPESLPPDVASRADVSLPARGSMLDSLARGVEALAPRAHVLAVAADLPLLSSAAVDAFLDACAGRDAGIYYSIVPREVTEQRYPGVRKTYVRMVEGTFCGGGLILFAPAVVERLRPLVARAVAARKRPWQLAQMLGVGTLVKLALGRLSVVEAEARASALAGITTRAVIVPHPEIALDVDGSHPETLALAREVLARR